MKKNKTLPFIITFFSILLLNSSCEEGITVDQDLKNFVTQEKALEIAKSIAWDNTSMKSVREILPVIDENSETVFYIINFEEGGFIILSADNRISPILAYSHSTSFRTNGEQYSSGLVNWLANNKDYVKHIRGKNEEQTIKMELQWENVVIPDRNNSDMPLAIEPPTGCEDFYEEVEPLLTTTWGQGCGFNDEMPTVTCSSQPCIWNNRAYAGCVPVAIAQVMKYYNHPTSYNWTNMPNSIGMSTTADFIRDIYDAIPGSKKSYDCDATGVNKNFNTAGLFTNNFNYSSASQADYNPSTVKQQLRWNRPVILGGGKDVGWWIFRFYDDGHMWVCDGFQDLFIWNEDCSMGWGYLYFNMNWGWNGYEDGWYANYEFNPDEYSFNYQMKMVYNIAP